MLDGVVFTDHLARSVAGLKGSLIIGTLGPYADLCSGSWWPDLLDGWNDGRGVYVTGVDRPG